MSDRFDFEQQIQKCWIVTDDLEELSEAIMEGKYVKYQDKDEICNALNGLSSMYNLKFNKLWDLFEHPIMDIVRENKMLNEECAALRTQLQESDPDGHGYGIAAIKPKKKDKK